MGDQGHWPGHRTLVHAFAHHLEHTPDTTAIELFEGAGEVQALSYRDLDHGARRVARQFAAWGIRRGERVVMALPTSRDFFEVYFAAWLSGVIPVVVPAPRPRVPLEAWAPLVGALAMFIEARCLIVQPAYVEPLAPLLPPSSMRLAGTGELRGDDGSALLDYAPEPAEVAHLQATSGSTGVPRVAVIGHSQLAANVLAIGQAIRHRDGDVLLSWLPLFHDMGLVGVSYAQFWGCPLVMADTQQFARNPLVWPRMMTRFRGTLSPAPTSAYRVCARLAEGRPQEFQLSAWRVALCGAEPVHAQSIEHFQRVFGEYGFRRQAMLPVYGLAEATLASTMPDPDEPPHVDWIAAEPLQERGVAEPASAGRGLPMVALGAALPGHRIRVVDGNGRELPERQVGEVQFAGPSVIDRYVGRPSPDAALHTGDGYLLTGDLGYLADGNLYVTGRSKDIIISGGRNFVPAQLESEVEAAFSGGAPAAIAVVGVPNAATATESVNVVIEVRDPPRSDAAEIEARIRARFEELFGLTGITVHWVSRGFIPKTTSGKVQRYRCREKLAGRSPA